MPVLYINNDELVKFTNKLEQLNKTTLPNVVRKTLNDAAMDVKKNTMPVQAKNSFTIRQANFFTATSRVEFASRGTDINKMMSSVGFMDSGLKGSNNYSVKELQQQEYGGAISKRSFIPLMTARKDGTIKSLVKPKNRLSAIKNVVDARNMRGDSRKAKFIRAMHKAGAGGYVLGETANGKEILWRINSLEKDGKGRIDITGMYSFSKGRSANIKTDTHFMLKASKKTEAENLERIYILNAKKRIERDLKV